MAVEYTAAVIGDGCVIDREDEGATDMCTLYTLVKLMTRLPVKTNTEKKFSPS